LSLLAALATAALCAGPAPEPSHPDLEQRIVQLVNLERRRAGLAPLKRVDSLTAAARWFARDMASDDYVHHDTHDRRGNGLVRRCRWRERLSSYYPGSSSLAENLAGGPETPEEAVEGWMRSPGHRANILRRSLRETGTGYWAGGSAGSYWVQDFGRRSGTFPLVIDDEAPSTASPQVRLYVHGDWAEMRLRNDEEPFSPWRRFSNELSWRLGDGDGTRRVEVELRSGARKASASDTIERVSRTVLLSQRPLTTVQDTPFAAETTYGPPAWTQSWNWLSGLFWQPLGGPAQ
jgi:uncharacterized protein YkwD